MSVKPGEDISFFVSSSDDATARIVRLHRRTDLFEEVDSLSDIALITAVQPLQLGSSARLVQPAGEWPADLDVTLSLLLTRIVPDRRGVVTFGPERGLFVEGGQLVCRWDEQVVVIERMLECNVWYWLEFTLPGGGSDNVRGRTMSLTLKSPGGKPELRVSVEAAGATSVDSGELRLSGWAMGSTSSEGCVDAKLSAVSLRSRISGLVASWSFHSDPGRKVVRDTSGRGQDLLLMQHPRRAVTGPKWDGSFQDPRLGAEHYDAVAFHSDDMTDAGWIPSCRWTIPDDLSSGAYALEVTGSGGTDHIPFFVTPAPGRARNRIAFLVPTFSYLAYGNERHWWDLPDVESRLGGSAEKIVQAPERWAWEQGLLSCYDRHLDGTGCTHSSWLRPIVNFRADYHHPYIGGPHQLSADVIILDWLDQEGIEVDLITDHDLHIEGAALLMGYRLVMTGSHPEYVSGPELNALDAFTARGGNLMYLGGNGFHAVVTTYPDSQHVMELRRGQAGATHWKTPPGETYHAATGEFGGQWLQHNRSPHRLFGVGTGGVSFEKGRGLRRTAASRDAAVDWIFEGVDGDEIDTPGAVMGGPAGFEFDRMSEGFGTPRETVQLATAVFEPAVTDYTVLEGHWTGEFPENRCDLTFIPPRNGRGAVFAAGSISWSSCLLTPGPNKVSTVTHNVIRHLTDR